MVLSRFQRSVRLVRPKDSVSPINLLSYKLYSCPMGSSCRQPLTYTFVYSGTELLHNNPP